MKHAFLKLCLFLAHHLLAYLCKYVCKDEMIRNGLVRLKDLINSAHRLV